MKFLKIIGLIIFCLTTTVLCAQNSEVVNSRVQKLEDVVDKNEYKARLALRNAKIAFQNLMNAQKNGKIEGKKFEKKKIQIEDAMEKARIALKTIYEINIFLLN